jgi:hypothetical protein
VRRYLREAARVCAMAGGPAGHAGASVDGRDGRNPAQDASEDAEPTAGQGLLSSLIARARMIGQARLR